MTAADSPRCPDPERLRALLDDQLPTSDQAELTAHLEACAACRGKLDRLAGESLWWDDAHLLAAAEPAASLAAAGPAPGGDDAPETSVEPNGDRAPRAKSGGLPFLEPTDETGCIGRFGPYEVLGVVGRGGMGVVLKAFDPGLHRVVAVKVLAPQLAAGAAARRRFVREARAAASVCHEHVVTIHAVDERAGWPYLVMQYVGGKSLQDRIDHNGPLEVKEILRIAYQAASGLAAAHAQGLVHRDIKPANILLENGVERVKITDFGLARAVDDPSLTQAGVVAGTPQYMSPEQARGEPVDARSDLFSLGCVMYAMATARPPFRGDSTMAVLRKVSDEAPRSIRESNTDIPAWLEAIVMKLLAKDPALRYQTASELASLLADHLAKLQQGRPIVESGFTLPADLEEHASRPATLAFPAVLGDVGPQKSPLGRFRPRRWQIAAAVGLLGLLALGTTETLGVTKVADTLATVLRIKTPEGTLVIQVDNPETEVSVDGQEIVIRGAGVRELKVKAGPHWVESRQNGVPIWKSLIAVEHNGKQVLKVDLEPEDMVEARVDPSPAGSVHPLFAQLPYLRRLFENTGTRRVGAEKTKSEAEFLLKKAEIDAKQAESGLNSARVSVERAEALHKSGQSSRGELQAAREALARAQAEWEAARIRHHAVRARLELASGLVHQAEQQQSALGGALEQAAHDGGRSPDVVRLLEGMKDRDKEYRQGFAKQIAEMNRARLALAENRLKLAQEIQSFRQEQLARIEALHNAGAISQEEVNKARAEAEKAQTDLEKEQVELDQAKEQIEEIAQQDQNAEGEAEDPEEEMSDVVEIRLLEECEDLQRVFDLPPLLKPGSDFERSFEGMGERIEKSFEGAGTELRRGGARVERRAIRNDSTARRQKVEQELKRVEEILQRIDRSVRDPQKDPAARGLRQQIERLYVELKGLEGGDSDRPQPGRYVVTERSPDSPEAPELPEARERPEPPERPEAREQPELPELPDAAEKPPVPGPGGLLWLRDLNRAKAQAAAENRCVLVYFSAVNAEKCRVMDKAVLTDPEVKTQLEPYVRVLLSTDVVSDPSLSGEEQAEQARRNLEFEKKLIGRTTPPRFVVFDPEGGVVAQAPFVTDVKKFVQFLEDAPTGFVAWFDTPQEDLDERRVQAEETLKRLEASLPELERKAKESGIDWPLRKARKSIESIRSELEWFKPGEMQFPAVVPPGATDPPTESPETPGVTAVAPKAPEASEAEPHDPVAAPLESPEPPSVEPAEAEPPALPELPGHTSRVGAARDEPHRAVHEKDVS